MGRVSVLAPGFVAAACLKVQERRTLWYINTTVHRGKRLNLFGSPDDQTNTDKIKVPIGRRQEAGARGQKVRAHTVSICVG